jgi:membrane associated rhomboid family serine protease
MLACVAVYVVELVLLRAGGAALVDALTLSPREVLAGRVWQPFTYAWLHSPRDPSHLLFNLLLLYSFGGRLEGWWGPRRFLTAYLVFLLGGGLLTVAVGALAQLGPLSGLLEGVWLGPHLGASGAVMGMVVAYGLTHGDERVQLLLGPPMTARTLVWVLVGLDLLVALSFSPVSSSSHFGGMLAAVVLCRGLWRPSRWRALVGRARLEARRRGIERELRVIDGGKARPPPDDPRRWN